ncbi:unnamed protein product [Phyllotreta striolata]|uniref:C2H2-type domain-containing protein n=1 Tax=Phyllotreta striolata TaxID=444603 RepID=A0A9N9TTY6_PHYSR|nr:unnamed protein product [Phyllotreta striolata]
MCVLGYCAGRYRCPNCGRSYKNKVNLGRHMRWECNKSPAYFCHACDYKTCRKDHLKVHLISNRHLKNVAGKIRYPCLHCGKSYTMKNNLRRHQRVECGKEKSLVCYVCDRRYYYKQELDTHVKLKHNISAKIEGFPVPMHWKF